MRQTSFKIIEILFIQAIIIENLNRNNNKKKYQPILATTILSSQKQIKDQVAYITDIDNEMFKKKQVQNYEIQSMADNNQRNNQGVQDKLQQIISSNSRTLQQKQQINKISPKVQPSSFFSKYNQQEFAHQEVDRKKKSPIPNFIPVIPQQKKDQPKTASFESQLKGLIKIVYQKEKEIEKLKSAIKDTSIRTSTECKNCQKNKITPSMQLLQSQQLNLNIDDIKETTSKIIELEAKQSQLHEIIDFFVKKEQDSHKKHKELSSMNKQLLSINHELQSWKQNQIIKYSEVQQEREMLKTLMKLKEEEIMRLNTDILNVISQARLNQNQMSQKITILQREIDEIHNQKLQRAEEKQIQFEHLRSQLKKDISNLKTNQKELSNIIEIQNNQMKTLARKLQTEKEQIFKNQQEFKEREVIFKQECQKKSAQIEELSQLVTKITFNLSEQKNQIAQLKIQNDQLITQLLLTKAKLQQTQSQTQSSKGQQNSQLNQQVRKNASNKSTIEEYIRLLEKMREKMQEQQDFHEKQIRQHQENLIQMESKTMKLQESMQEEKGKLQIQIKRLNEELKAQKEMQIQFTNRTQLEIESLKLRYESEVDKLNIQHEAELRVMEQKLNLTEEQLSITKVQFSQLKSELSNTLRLLSTTETQLSSTKISLQQISQKLSQKEDQLNQTKIKLSQQQDQIQQLTQTLAKAQTVNAQNQKDCNNCHQLQNKLKEYQQRLQMQQKDHNDQIISLPTINNLSYIDLANSSFQCKLQEVAQFSSRHFLTHESQAPKLTRQTQKKKKTVTFAPLQQNLNEENSLQENSSYIRYQDQLLQDLEKQCQQNTEIFLGQNDRTKMVELSEIKQSLKMTKEVNFQLFDEINRQQKIINECKNTIRSFLQSQRQPTNNNNKGKSVSQPSLVQESILEKLENLLLLK